MTRVAGEEGKADWSPLHLENDCFPPTTLEGGNSQTCTKLRLLSLLKQLEGGKKGWEKVWGLWHKLCKRTQARKYNPYPRTPLCRCDWIQNANKTALKAVSLRQRVLHHKEGGNTKRKEKLNWVWVQGQCEAVRAKVGDLPKNTESINLRGRRPCPNPCRVAGKMVSCEKFIRGCGRLTR